MTGEMSASEVTRENYPELFELHDELSALGIKSEPKPFDQYQGPYLAVRGVCEVWYADTDEPLGHFAIEAGHNKWLTDGVDRLVFGTDQSEAGWPVFISEPTEFQYSVGHYTVRGAAKRIAALAKAR